MRGEIGAGVNNGWSARTVDCAAVAAMVVAVAVVAMRSLQMRCWCLCPTVCAREAQAAGVG